MKELLNRLDDAIAALKERKKEIVEAEKEISRLNNEKDIAFLLHSPLSPLNNLDGAEICETAIRVFNEFAAYGFRNPGLKDLCSFSMTLAEKYEFFNQAEREEVFIAIKEKLLPAQMNEKLFKMIFLDGTYSHKDRLKYVTDGSKGVLVSKETEEKVLEAHKKIYVNMFLVSLFESEDKNKLFLESLQLTLFIYTVKGTRFNTSKPIQLLNRLVSFSTDEVFQREINAIAQKWYYDNGFTFIHLPRQYDFDVIHKLFPLLKEKDREALFSEFLSRFEENISKCEKSIYRTKDYSENNHHKLLLIKDRMKIMKQYEKLT